MVHLFPRNYELTTAEITYRLPDYPSLVQTFLWQNLDEPPKFPRFLDFLKFWEEKLDGKVKSYWVTSSGILVPRVRIAKCLERIH